MQAISSIDNRQIAPVTDRVNAILEHVKMVTGVARHAAGGANAGVRRRIDRVVRRLRGRRAAERGPGLPARVVVALASLQVQNEENDSPNQ